MRLTLYLNAVDNMSRVVRGSMRNTQAAVDAAQAHLQSVQNNARNAMMDSGMMVAGGAMALAYPLKQAANFEMLRLKMDILTRSTIEGGRAYAAVVKLAKDSPLSLAEVANAQTMMMGYGQSAKDATVAIKMLGDMTSVTGGDLQGAIVAYGQAAQEGKLLTRDIRQLINSGVPAVTILKDYLGQNADVMKMASESKITFDVLQKAMQKATATGGLFANGLEQQSNTLGGKWAKISDEFNVLAATFGNAVLPSVKGLLDGLLPLMSAFGEFIKENKWLAKAVMWSGAVFVMVAASSFIFNGIVWAGTFALRGYAGSVLVAAWRLTGLSMITKALGFQFFRLRFAIYSSAIAQRFMASVGSFQLIPMLLAASKGVYGLAASFIRLTVSIFNIPIVGWVLAVVAAVIALGVVIYKNWDAISGFFSMMWNKFKEFLPKAKQWGLDLISSIKNGIVSAAPTLFAALDGVVKFARGFFPASPAKRGAFKDLHRVKIIEQVARAVRPNALSSAIGKATDIAASSFGGTGTAMMQTVGGGQVSVNYSPTINFGGGGGSDDKQSFLSILNSHKDEIARMIKDANRSSDRKRF